jgi:hypothetical protein
MISHQLFAGDADPAQAQRDWEAWLRRVLA